MSNYPQLLSAAFLTTALSWSAGSAATFTGLGDLPGGSFYSSAIGVSADGSTVVGQSEGASIEAFRWTRSGGITGLGGGSADAASANGSVIVGISGGEAFRWTENDGLVLLGRLGTIPTEATGVSGDGSIVTGYSRDFSSPGQAFRWTQSEGMTALGFLPGGYSSGAFAISLDGTTIVGTSTNAATTLEAFRWTASDGMTGIGDLPGGLPYSYANAVSADGSVIVGLSHGPNGSESFRWTEATGMVRLGDSTNQGALGVSADGSVVVGQRYNPAALPDIYESQAFIWDESHGSRSLQEVLTVNYGLNLTGWLLTSATGVSADGRTIVGTGTNPDGFVEGWIVTLVPEPQTGVLACFSIVVGLICVRIKKQIANLGAPRETLTSRRII